LDRLSAGWGCGSVREQARRVFRAVFVPSLSQALAPTRDAGERQVFADRLEEGVRRRIATSPASLENMVGIITLHKQATDWPSANFRFSPLHCEVGCWGWQCPAYAETGQAD
jgi:hypothetical protein